MAEILLEAPSKITGRQNLEELTQLETEKINFENFTDLSSRAVHLVMMHAKSRQVLQSTAFESANLGRLNLDELTGLAKTVPQVLKATEKWLHGTTSLDESQRTAQTKIETAIAGSMSDIILDKTRHELRRLKAKRARGEIQDEDYRRIKEKFDRRIDHSLDFVIASNHSLRTLATEHGFGRHELRQSIIALSPRDKLVEARHLEEGIAAEAAVYYGMEHIVSELDESGDGVKREVKFGEVDDDIKGGDIVYTSGGRKFYIDVKAYNPDDEQIDPDRYGLKFEQPTGHGYDFHQKAIIRFPRPELINDDYTVSGSGFYQVLTEAIDQLESSR